MDTKYSKGRYFQIKPLVPIAVALLLFVFFMASYFKDNGCSRLGFTMYNPPKGVKIYSLLSPTKKEIMNFLEGDDYHLRGSEMLAYNVGGGQSDVARIMSMYSIYTWLKEKNPFFANLLFFNEGDMSNPHFSPYSLSFDVHQYVKHSDGTVEGDIHDLSSVGENVYDGVYIPQTLEHSYNPFLGLENIRRIMKSGGWVISSQPFITRPHMQPYHYYSYTPYGLHALFSTSGFYVDRIVCWGNDEYNSMVLLNRKWPRLTDMTSLKTKDNHYSQCTVFAQKI